MNFYVDGQYVKAICSGQATDKEKLYPIISDKSEVEVLLPTDGQDKMYNENGELKNPDTETELQIKLPATSKLTFYIDEVLPTGNFGSITTNFLYKWN